MFSHYSLLVTRNDSQPRHECWNAVPINATAGDGHGPDLLAEGQSVGSGVVDDAGLEARAELVEQQAQFACVEGADGGCRLRLDPHDVTGRGLEGLTSRL